MKPKKCGFYGRAPTIEWVANAILWKVTRNFEKTGPSLVNREIVLF